MTGTPTDGGQESPEARTLRRAVSAPSLFLGLERMGLAALRFPVAAFAIAALLAVLASAGVPRLKIDDSLSDLFRSNNADYQTYETVTRRFPSAEYDVLAVIEGEKLLNREQVAALRDLATDMQLVEGVGGVISLFSIRAAPQGDHPPDAIFPEELPQGQAYRDLIAAVQGNELIRGKLLSEDGRLTLMVISLQPGIAAGPGRGKLLAAVRAQAGESLAGTGLKFYLSGVPVMQQEIMTAVERDRLVYNAGGFILGCLIAIIFFRRVSFMVVAAAPPLLAILLALGVLGWMDIRLNMFLNVMTPLVMVISFSDSMQIVFAARDRLLAGEDRTAAFSNAIRIAGPACVLAHATAAFSFVALMFARSELIRTFGLAGLMATVIALVAVLVLTPVLGVLLVRAPMQEAGATKLRDAGVMALRSFCAFVATRMIRHARAYTVIAVAIVTALVVVYGNLQPRYRLADQVPSREQAVAANSRLDTKLTGANPVDVFIQFPEGASLYDAGTLAAISAAHHALQEQKGIGNVWSLESLRRWLAEKAHRTDVATLRSYVDILPASLKGRFIAPDAKSVIVSGRTRDIDASALLPVIDNLENSLAGIRNRFPGYTFRITGLSVVAARNSADMIGRMNRALTVEIIFVAAFIGWAFRSVLVAFVCLLPGIFPVVLAGSLLALRGEGLSFAAVVALTVSFGLGISATIHFLNRWRIEDTGDIATGVERATVLVGPALILTSVVLACALAATTLSGLPSLQTFGWLAAIAMLAALAADFFILRPTMVFGLSLVRRNRRSPPAQ